jgi:hypothetical protein
LDYDTTFKPDEQDALYEPNAYRSSDHDPVVVGLNLINYPPTADAGGPYTVVEGNSVTLNATGVDPEGTAVTFAWDLDNNGTFETAGQSATFTAPNNSAPAIFTVKVKVTDAFGNFAVDDAFVTVIYNFKGFFAPVLNPPAFNEVNAGKALPIKFSLTGDQGLSIIAAGYPKSQVISCDLSTTNPMDATDTTGQSGLSYNAAADEYTYVWKTNKSWAGTCRVVTIQLNDGTVHELYFKFK